MLTMARLPLVDQLLRHSGSFRENQSLDERAMDSMAQEKERDNHKGQKYIRPLGRISY